MKSWVANPWSTGERNWMPFSARWGLHGRLQTTSPSSVTSLSLHKSRRLTAEPGGRECPATSMSPESLMFCVLPLKSRSGLSSRWNLTGIFRGRRTCRRRLLASACSLRSCTESAFLSMTTFSLMDWSVVVDLVLSIFRTNEYAVANRLELLSYSLGVGKEWC